MMASIDYFNSLIEIIQKVKVSQIEAIQTAAHLIALSIKEGGVLHSFGVGHSCLLAIDIYYRAGGLIPINVILEPSLMLQSDVLKATQLERLEGYAKIIIEHQDVRPCEVIIVISNSGLNVVPVEMALEAKERALKVIALTSVNYSSSVPPRHRSGKRLMDIADIVLDNHVPPGDAAIQIDDFSQKVGPTSTVIGSAILHAVIVQTIAELIDFGMVPPVYVSHNLESEGHKKNREMMARYRDRILKR